MASGDLDRKSCIGEVRPELTGVGLEANVRREAGDSDYGPSLEELCLKGVQEDRIVVGRGTWVKRRIFL